MRRNVVRVLGVAMLLALGGCFRYVPAAPGGPDQGDRVRAHLAAPAEYRVGDFTVHNILLVDGEVVHWGAEELVLSAWELRSGLGQEYGAAGQTVEIPLSNLRQLEARRISASRTAAVAGAVVALGVLIPRLLQGGGGGGGNGGPPTQPN